MWHDFYVVFAKRAPSHLQSEPMGIRPNPRLFGFLELRPEARRSRFPGHRTGEVPPATVATMTSQAIEKLAGPVGKWHLLSPIFGSEAGKELLTRSQVVLESRLNLWFLFDLCA